MNFLYNRYTGVVLTALAITTAACGQNAKVKTITIINGDTTVSEKEIGDKEIAEIEKQITIVTNEEGDKSNKKVIKKIIVNGGNDNGAEAMAYAYKMGDDKDGDMEVTTSDDGKETKIIIKNGNDDKSDDKEKKTVIKKSINTEEKESMSLNINVKNNVAKIEVETNSKEPLNVSVLDENGKQVFYDSKKDGGKYNKEIKLEKGTYFLNLIQNKKTTNDKIVIQ